MTAPKRKRRQSRPYRRRLGCNDAGHVSGSETEANAMRARCIEGTARYAEALAAAGYRLDAEVA